MEHEKILTALEEISDTHIAEAEKPPKKRVRTVWKIAAAAVLVVAIGVNALFAPSRIHAEVVAEASQSRAMAWPDSDDYKTWEDWNVAYDVWSEEEALRRETTTQAMSSLRVFFQEGNRSFLVTETNENTIWSPVNAYIGLAMTAELTTGETRQQLLDLFGTKDTEELREQVSAVWESVYKEDSHEVSVLANSLWLEEGLQYNQKVMDVLGYHYYASVYQADLGSSRTNKDIAAWLDNHTGSFLKDSTKNISLSPETVLALYSTLYFQAKWSDKFSESRNTEGVFHTPDGDVTAIYMNKNLKQMDYYWGETFGAVNLWLKNGSCMWFILPDEGKTVEDVLNDGAYMEMVSSDQWEDSKYMKVNLSVPKFDVSAAADLREGLKDMGVTKVFEENVAEFSELTGDTPIYLTGANQSVRVQIDEEGVKAAAYLEIKGAGSAAPPEEIIDFVLDRPFLFVIARENVPLFAGCVNYPES